jgi:hypothetical protein
MRGGCICGRGGGGESGPQGRESGTICHLVIWQRLRSRARRIKHAATELLSRRRDWTGMGGGGGGFHT